MKKILINIFVTFVFAIYSNAQTKHPPSILLQQNSPLVVIDSYLTAMNYFFINTNQIDAINVYKDSMAIAKYGEKGKEGVIEIKLKPYVQLLTAKDVLSQHKFNQNNLRICVNKTIIDKLELLLFDVTEIVSVEIINNPKWVHTTDIKKDEQFINITVKETGNNR